MGEIEFGKTCVGEIIKTLRAAASVGLVVEVTSQDATGRSYRISAQRYLRCVNAILGFERDGEKVFSLETLKGTKVRFLSLIESLDYEAERLCLVEMGNQWFFKKFFGEPKVQDC